MQIDKPGEYVTRKGERVIVRIVDWPGAHSVIGHFHGSSLLYKWCSNGLVNGASERPNDIVDVYRPMVEREGWLPVYGYDGGERRMSMRSIAKTKGEAESIRRPSSIAIAHITWEEPADE